MFLRLFTVPCHPSLESIWPRLLLKANEHHSFKTLSAGNGPGPPWCSGYSQFLPPPKSMAFVSILGGRKGMRIPKPHLTINPSLGMIFIHRSFLFLSLSRGRLLFLVKPFIDHRHHAHFVIDQPYRCSLHDVHRLSHHSHPHSRSLLSLLSSSSPALISSSRAPFRYVLDPPPYYSYILSI